MRKSVFSILILFQFLLTSNAQEKLDYFLPGDITYDKTIPTPEQYFGQQVGEWHLTYDQVLFYMKDIARVSNRAIIQEYARSWENRPLIHLIFTSEENHKNLDELKELHVKHADPSENISKKDVPLVVNLGYGVHGNESSATNSSVLTAYYLAAAQGEKIDRLLKNTIILVDPSLNPDGLTRHSTWANMHQSETTMTSADSRQFDEVWPGGRTNHYWFDLNRDYLLLVNPESRGRVAKLHEWKPNIVTDHHEMDANSTFFFQPGVPSRNNPLTPEKNYTLTHEIAKYHARFLDKIGVQYFSEEQFDDYYFGKGSSYPDINSGVGILFEQAGFRSRIRETSEGVRKLAYGIRNQFTVTLSTLEAAVDLKDDLLGLQKEFYKEALQLAEKDLVKAYIFGNETDKIKTQLFVEFLNQHQIEVFRNEKETAQNGMVFKAGSSFVVPTKQKQYRLVKTFFDEVTSFADSTFYDVSTWTFPYAFDIPFTGLNSLKNLQYSSQQAETIKKTGEIIGGKSSLAYLFKWNEYTVPKSLYQIQNKGLITKVSTKEFSYEINGTEVNFTYGSILVPVSGQSMDEEKIFNLISAVAKETGIDFYGLKTGLSPRGIDLGSNYFVTLEKPEILMLIGGSVGSREAGEIWHLFDQRYQIPVCLAESGSLSSVDLSKYNTIIMPGGTYNELDKTNSMNIKTWAQQGGTLIAMGRTSNWAAQNEIGKTKFKKATVQDSTLNLPYTDRSKISSLNTISGAIFKTEMDITHPLCFGYLKKDLAVFKTGTTVAEPLNINYSEPVKFGSDPYISGFVSDKNLERIKNAPVVSVQQIGQGNLISFHENLTFRGIWLGTNKLFSNAVFFGGVIR